MAHTIQPKKLLIVNIIDILERYTDSEHTLTQREIGEILERDYMMKVDRKSVQRNLMDLIDCDSFELQYEEKPRQIKKLAKDPQTGKMVPTGEVEEGSVFTDFSIVRDFTEGELRYLIDGVFASNHIPNNHRRDLVRKIEKLGGKHFKAHAGNITKEAPVAVYTKQLFFNIGLLDDAIQKRRKVRFHYKYFGLDKQPHYQVDKEGKLSEYVVSPYEMVAKNGKYYLICNKDTHDNLANYRVDRIADVEILDEKARPLKDLADGSSIDRYLRDHVFMYAGKGVRCKFRIVKRMVSDLVDIFGADFTISELDNDSDGFMTVTATVNADSMVQFAMSFAPDVIVLSPQSVVDQIRNNMQEALKRYNKREKS